MSLTARERGLAKKAKKPTHPASARRANATVLSVTSGIPISKAELQQAFDFFDVHKKGHLTMDDLKARLPIFYKNLPNRELRLLMNNKHELTFNDLYEMLADNMISNFDPVAEAFKIYDTKATGFVNIDVLKSIFGQLGFGEIADEDVKIVIETADADGDGKIGLEDFRSLLTRNVDLGVINTEASK